MPPVNQTMDTPAKEVEIPVPWGVIKGKWWGSQEKQPLLAIHGWQDNACTFDTLAPLLLPETSVLCIDLPGHGLSTHIPKGMMYYLFWDALIVIRRIVLYYKWDKVSLIGHSLGGAAGFLYAAIYPDKVDKLIEIDICAPRVVKPEPLLKEMGACIDRFLKLEKVDGKLAPCYEYNEMINTALEGHKGSLTKESVEVLMKRGMKPEEDDPSKFKFTRDVKLKTAGLAMFSREEVLVYASKIKCDYMNIRGVPGMQFEVPELYKECLDKIKQSARRFEYHEIPGTHHLHLNNPNDIAGLISKFLAQGDTNNVNNSDENNEDYPV